MICLEHVDINPTLVCTYRCASCSHFSPFSKPYWMQLETMVEDLDALKPFAHFEQLCFAGGEPTLCKNLPEFMDAARASGIADEICVITNGSLLHKMKEPFWSKLDALRLSVYARLDKSAVALAQEKALEYGFRLDAWEYPEFFAQLKSIPDDGVESFRTCCWKECFTIHENHFYLCPQSVFAPPRFLGHESTDGLPLEGLTEEKLTAYLNRTEPFEACRICCANTKQAFPWRESKNAAEWLKESTA